MTKLQTFTVLTGIVTAPSALLWAVMASTSPTPATYQLVLERNGNVYVLDTDQSSFDDCQGAASIAVAVSTLRDDVIYCETE